MLLNAIQKESLSGRVETVTVPLAIETHLFFCVCARVCVRVCVHARARNAILLSLNVEAGKKGRGEFEKSPKQ